VTQEQFVFVASLMVALALVRLAWLARRPKQRTFRCARCDAIAEHNARTMQAWRQWKVDFFCEQCHAKSIAANEKHARPASSGCFGAMVLMFSVPLGTLVAAIVGW
jgi:hypothetical protein